MITEATEILEVMEAARGAPRLRPGLPANEYLSGEVWEWPDQAELLFARRKRFLAEIGFCLVTAEVIDALASLLAKKRSLKPAPAPAGWLPVSVSAESTFWPPTGRTTGRPIAQASEVTPFEKFFASITMATP